MGFFRPLFCIFSPAMSIVPTDETARRRYFQTSFPSEAALFDVLETNRDAVLGKNVVWVPRAFLFGRGATGDLADAYAIDLEEGGWWMVQTELGRSDFWSDVVPRISRRLTSLQHGMFRMWLAETALVAAISRAGEAARDYRWNSLRMARTLRSILDTPPRLALAMDAVLPVAKDWSATLRYETRLIEITRHIAQGDPSDVCYRIPVLDSGASTVISGLEPADDAIPASRFVLVQRREQVQQAGAKVADTASEWLVSA